MSVPVSVWTCARVRLCVRVTLRTGEFSVSPLGYCAVCPGVDVSELCLCEVVVWDCVSVLLGIS